jgi:proteic killer suppression protein
VIKAFHNKASEDIINGLDSSVARKVCPKELWHIARRKLDQINRVTNALDLQIPPGNRLEHLKGDRSGQLSIRIKDQYCICFLWEDGNAFSVEITDYHKQT